MSSSGKPYFIAEIGINHNGDMNKAIDLIHEAKNAGADCVKFQKRNPILCVPKDRWNDLRSTPWGQMTYLNYKQAMEFGQEEYDEINQLCKSIGIEWTASVWDIDSLEFMMQYLDDIPFIKLPSAKITDMKLIEYLNKFPIDVCISTGMSTEEEVFDAVKAIKNLKILLHCNSSYPSNEAELDLLVMRNFIEWWPKIKIGYSGHELGTLPTIMAATLGAEVIERHITLHKEDWGTDHSSSLEPDQLKKLIYNLSRVDDILGGDQIKVYQAEKEAASKLRNV